MTSRSAMGCRVPAVSVRVVSKTVAVRVRVAFMAEINKEQNTHIINVAYYANPLHEYSDNLQAASISFR